LKFVPCLKSADHLVAIGFRNWMAGYHTGNIEHWEETAHHYEDRLGSLRSVETVKALATWVRCINAATRRDIEVFPPTCTSFCRDECLAVAMVAASQHQIDVAARSSAEVLTAGGYVDEVLESAECFAAILRMMGQTLSAGMLARYCPN
jgi:hypothetical protein